MMTHPSSNSIFDNIKNKIYIYLYNISSFITENIKNPIINLYNLFFNTTNNDIILEPIDEYNYQNIDNNNNEHTNEINNDNLDTDTDTECISRKVSYSNINEIHEISISHNSISQFINNNYILKDQ